MCSPLPSRSFPCADAPSWSLFQVISPFFLLCSLLWSSGTRAEILSLETLLASDGKINVPADFRGLIDFSGYQVILDPCEGPVFKPLPLTPGWSAVSSDIFNNVVRVIAVNGTDLYAGGAFRTIGSLTVNFIAKWDGSSWSALGAAPNVGVNDEVLALVPSGGGVYVGGRFPKAANNTLTVNFVAFWDGSNWSPVGNAPKVGVEGTVNELALIGSDLYVGGRFQLAGVDFTQWPSPTYYEITASNIARWNGVSWSRLGTAGANGVNGDVEALTASGGDLYVGGKFTSAAGTTVNYIAKWNGTSWSALGNGIARTDLNSGHSVLAIAVNGIEVYAGGEFSSNGTTTVNNIARWDGSNWHALGTAPNIGVNGTVYAISGSSSGLIVGGGFSYTGSNVLRVNFITRWDGSNWHALGVSPDVGVSNGGVWSIVPVEDYLLVGGNFVSAAGSTITANRIARWEEAPLPVSLSAFSVKAESDKVVLHWITQSETNNAHFVVEHSPDGLSFKALGQIQGKGNRLAESAYSFIHSNPGPGTHYYRLQQVDYDGTSAYSSIQSAVIKPVPDGINLFPNPFSESVSIEIPCIGPTAVRTKWIDFSGRVVHESLLNCGQNELALMNLPSGIYWMEADLNGEILRAKVVKK